MFSQPTQANSYQNIQLFSFEQLFRFCFFSHLSDFSHFCLNFHHHLLISSYKLFQQLQYILLIVEVKLRSTYTASRIKVSVALNFPIPSKSVDAITRFGGFFAGDFCGSFSAYIWRIFLSSFLLHISTFYLVLNGFKLQIGHNTLLCQL